MDIKGVIDPLQLILAFALDGLIGDPGWLPHPVRMIGSAIAKTERFLQRHLSKMQRLAGVLLVIVVVGVSFVLALTVQMAVYRAPIGSIASFIIMAYLISTTLALRELVESAGAVLAAIKDSNIKAARQRLSRIVGRDTEPLDEEGILRATLETLSENASDGVIAPMFYLALGGLPLAIAYKAVNTLDSMVGYKNDKYRDFGWAAARLDDIANYIPARITGILIAAASFAVTRSPLTVKNSVKTMLRDGRGHTSPNSGFPEAAMAGALGVRLGGPSAYSGITVRRPFIGEDRGADMRVALRQARGITVAVSVLGLLISLPVLYMRAAV